MELQKIQNTDIYEFTSTYDLGEEDIDKLSQSFKEFRERGEKIKLLGTIKELPKSISRSSFGKFYPLKRDSLYVVSKYAVVTDKAWIDNFVMIGNFFTPNIPIKTFHEENRTEALAWLEEDNIKEYSPEEYLANIDIVKLNQRTYKINLNPKKITYTDVTALYNLLDIEGKEEKLNILIEFESFPSIESFKTLVEGIRVDLKTLGSVKKYAVVSNAKWIEAFTKLGDLITPEIEMKFFSTAQTEEAQKWILSE